jgi:group I intron endonuclease
MSGTDMIWGTGVYCWRNRVNGKRYVGGGYRDLRKRWLYHRELLRKGKHPNPPLQEDWVKYGPKAFAFQILEWCPADAVGGREKYWMDHYRALDPRYGYNRSPTTTSNLGTSWTREMTPEARVGLAKVTRASIVARRRDAVEAYHHLHPSSAACGTRAYQWPRSPPALTLWATRRATGRDGTPCWYGGF